MTPRRVMAPLTLLCAYLSACTEEAAWELPEIVASSRYIDYGTWADTSAVCMDAKLRQWDQFIEQTADFLGVEPPSERIRYTWVPKQFDAPGRWGCSGTALGCYLGIEEGLFIFVHSPEILHELVHAVELPALGGAHPVLVEGMAEFLSTTTNTLVALDDFAEEFLALLESTERLAGRDDYRLAMHFVGSLVNSDGIVKYREFREALPRDGRLDEFASTYEAVFGEDLFGALEAMSSQPVTGLQVPSGCVEDPSLETISLTESGSLEAPLAGACGDPHFYGFGFEHPAPGFDKQFVLEVDVEGSYALTVQGPHVDTGPLVVQLESCPGTEFVYMWVEAGDVGLGTLGAGRHSLRVYYPPRPEPVGEAEISLKLRFAP